MNWHIAMRPPPKRKALDKSVVGELMEKLEHAKASIRAKVEHPFHVVKNLFGHRKMQKILKIEQKIAKSQPKIQKLRAGLNCTVSNSALP